MNVFEFVVEKPFWTGASKKFNWVGKFKGQAGLTISFSALQKYDLFHAVRPEKKKVKHLYITKENVLAFLEANPNSTFRFDDGHEGVTLPINMFSGSEDNALQAVFGEVDPGDKVLLKKTTGSLL